jgi:transcription termination factor NusB
MEEANEEQRRRARSLMAGDTYQLDCSRNPPLPEIDYSAARYTAAADNGQRQRRSDTKASEPFKGEQATRVSDPVNSIGSYYAKFYKGIKIDPYRIFDLYGISNGAQQHAIKKLLRAGESVKDLERDIDETIDSLRRWKDMLAEDKA